MCMLHTRRKAEIEVISSLVSSRAAHSLDDVDMDDIDRDEQTYPSSGSLSSLSNPLVQYLTRKINNAVIDL